VIADRPRILNWRLTDRRVLLAGAAVATVVVGHAIASARPVHKATPLVIFSHLYAVVLVAGLLALAISLGRAVLRRSRVEGGSRIEHGLFLVAIGLGLIATGVAGLGLAQLLSVPALALLVCALAFLARHQLVALSRELSTVARDLLALRRSLRAQGRGLSPLVPLTEILFVALLIHALAPPTSNAVLTYQLRGPARFLELGGVAPLWDLQQANMPFAVNMLYLIGLAFGSDEMGAVLHLTLAGLVAAAAFSFGRRHFGEQVGWIAATTFVSTQLMLVFASVAFVDYGLAFFDFLAVYAFFRWRESERRGCLIVSGALVGCALASKLLGGITALNLGVWLLVLAAHAWRQRGLTHALGLLLTFGVPAAMLAAPWYAKNLLWFGNLLWPFLASNPNDFNMYLGGTTRYSDSNGVLGTALAAATTVRGRVDRVSGHPAAAPAPRGSALPLPFEASGGHGAALPGSRSTRRLVIRRAPAAVRHAGAARTFGGCGVRALATPRTGQAIRLFQAARRRPDGDRTDVSDRDRRSNGRRRRQAITASRPGIATVVSRPDAAEQSTGHLSE